jgi:hypothetical protein
VRSRGRHSLHIRLSVADARKLAKEIMANRTTVEEVASARNIVNAAAERNGARAVLVLRAQAEQIVFTGLRPVYDGAVRGPTKSR